MYDQNGTPVRLGKPLGRGGEGTVHAVKGDSELVAKILHRARRRPGKYHKLQAMLRRAPRGAHEQVDGFPVLTWPKALLYDDPQRRELDTFVGYTTVRIRPRDFVPLFQVTSASRRAGLGGVPLTWDRLVMLAARLCHLVRTLHRFGYAVGDLNDRNILVSRRFTPLLMDTDSFQVPRGLGRHFSSMVGDQLYWPPELLGVDLNKHRRSRELGDRYALATLLFQLFMDGRRPYQARGSDVADLETLMDKTQAGHFPWQDPRPGALEPPARSPSYDALPADVRRLFYRAFVTGHKHPRRRPSAATWYRVLEQASKQGFQTCPHDKRHVHARGEEACPWCPDPHDRFGAKRRGSLDLQARRSAGLPMPQRAVGRVSPATRRVVAATSWWLLIATALAGAFLWLDALPTDLPKRGVTGAITVLVASLPGLWLAFRWDDFLTRWGVAGVWSLLAAAAIGWVATTLGWQWLTWSAGTVAVLTAVALFVWLERRRGAWRPDRRSLLHAASACLVAYLPALAVWALARA